MNRFAVTLTLRPAHFRNKAEIQYDRTQVVVCDVLRGLGTFSLVAELTKASNVHYHALLECDGSQTVVAKRLNDAVRRHPDIGFCCTKLCTDQPGWVDYMSKGFAPDHKDFQDFETVMKRKSIICDDLEVFPSKYRKHLDVIKKF